ncbi:FKBP-type peptidyl-prolyl cis-trans isomerase [Mucilaginibacter ginkgonis]|nr:FKBP-type peptidyl-prolyl cis-trans isomerase [Mucilaginibacter ginkgonis]
MKKLFSGFVALIAFIYSAKAQVVITQTPKGAQYQVFTHNTGPKIKLEDIVTFHVVQKTDRDSVVFSSYTIGHPVQIQVKPSQNVADLMEVFPLLANKDSALIKVPVDSVFKGHEKERPPFLSAKSYISYIVKIEKVQTLAEALAERNAELQKIQKAELTKADEYIAANKIPATSLPSGLKYVITQQGTGRKALTGDTVLVNYTGRTLAGKVFDTSLQSVAQAAGLQQPGRNYQPIQVILGQNTVIAGWEAGLRLLNQGAQATLIIPSSLAYGERGAGQDIGPFSTLLFDVELVKLNPGPRPATTAPAAKPITGAKTTVKKGTTVKKKVTHK